MPDQVRSVAEQLSDQRRLGREVPARQGRARAKARAIWQAQAPVLRQRELMTPGARRADDAAVHEKHGRTGAEASDLQVLRAEGRARARHAGADRSPPRWRRRTIAGSDRAEPSPRPRSQATSPRSSCAASARRTRWQCNERTRAELEMTRYLLHVYRGSSYYPDKKLQSLSRGRLERR